VDGSVHRREMISGAAFVGAGGGKVVHERDTPGLPV
jgi:hypothetical protein